MDGPTYETRSEWAVRLFYSKGFLEEHWCCCYWRSRIQETGHYSGNSSHPNQPMPPMLHVSDYVQRHPTTRASHWCPQAIRCKNSISTQQFVSMWNCTGPLSIACSQLLDTPKYQIVRRRKKMHRLRRRKEWFTAAVSGNVREKRDIFEIKMGIFRMASKGS